MKRYIESVTNMRLFGFLTLLYLGLVHGQSTEPQTSATNPWCNIKRSDILPILRRLYYENMFKGQPTDIKKILELETKINSALTDAEMVLEEETAKNDNFTLYFRTFLESFYKSLLCVSKMVEDRAHSETTKTLVIKTLSDLLLEGSKARTKLQFDLASCQGALKEIACKAESVESNKNSRPPDGQIASTSKSEPPPSSKPRPVPQPKPKNLPPPEPKSIPEPSPLPEPTADPVEDQEQKSNQDDAEEEPDSQETETNPPQLTPINPAQNPRLGQLCFPVFTTKMTDAKQSCSRCVPLMHYPPTKTVEVNY